MKNQNQMIEIRFRDIDPDTGGISQDMKIATCEVTSHAKWIKHALEIGGADEQPNREYYLVDREDPNRELTYEERIAWFVANYYETGMEYESLLKSMKTSNLDQFEWIGGDVIRFPKTVDESKLVKVD
jgi:hypothetical protein